MAPLDAALAFTHRDHAAAVVGQNLDLDVPGPLEILLDVHTAVAERLQRLAARRLKRAFHLGLRPDEPHALAPAARHGLDQHREAQALGLAARLDRIAQRRGGPRYHRHAGSLHPAPRFGFIAHGADRGGRRAHENETGILAGVRKRRALRQEAIARMDRLAAGVPGRRDQLGNGEIGFARGRGADQDRGVGVANVRGETVRLGVDRDGGEAFLVAGADHANRDFAAVRDQHPLQ